MSQSASSLNLASFVQDPVVMELLEDLKQDIARKKAADPDFGFSDYFDGQNWYVDLVQEGGGVLGVALTGYTYILEEVGIRFLKLAGTSAGAINTLLMSAADIPSNPKSGKVIEHLAQLDIASLADGDDDVQALIETLGDDDHGWLEMGYRIVKVLDDLKDHMGLNPGDEFLKWINNVLADWGIHNLADLDARMNDVPAAIAPLLAETRKGLRGQDWLMAIIAADLSTEIKAVLPQMAHLYYPDVKAANPGDFVRASMSVPYFFYPLIIRDVPQSDEVKELWRRETTYRGPHPESVLFVDGGLLSNFPIDVFHDWNRVPGRPTFGVKLGYDQVELNKVEDMSYTKLAGTMINAATKIRDRDFITQHPDFHQLVATIDVGEHDWLNFHISDEDKIDLFRRGAKAAVAFLKEFDWKKYKRKRQDQLYAVVDNVLGLNLDSTLDGAEVQYQLYAARARGISTRGLGVQPTSNARTRDALQQRLKYQYVYGNPFKALVISDDRESALENELKILESVKGSYQMCSGIQEAKSLLQDQAWDLIILDERNPENAGFFEALRQIEGAVSQPKLLLLRTQEMAQANYPKEVFAVAYAPVELLHAVMDALQR